jgi:hypothetical protein
LSALEFELLLGDRYATSFTIIEVERQSHGYRQIVIGAQGLLTPEVKLGVGTKPGLAEPPDRGIDVGASRAKLGVVGEGADNHLINRDLRAHGWYLPPRGNRLRHHSSNEGERERPPHGPHGRQRTGTENFVEPLPPGPSHVTVTWRVPRSGKSIVPR